MWWKKYKFKSNSQYLLVPLDNLENQHKKYLPKSYNKADFFGLLIPENFQANTAQLISRETALLFYYLQNENYLPSYLEDLFADTSSHFVETLLTKKIIEIVLDENTYLYPLTKITNDFTNSKKTKISEISNEAIRYAIKLNGLSKDSLIAKLYFYNRFPIFTGDLTDDELNNYLCLKVLNEKILSELACNWLITYDDVYDTWLNCRTKASKNRIRGIKHKLYVSPSICALKDTVCNVARIFNENKVVNFKIGKNISSLCRPDKIVAYFDSYDHLFGTAEKLWNAIGNYSAHGVPFTCQLYDTAMLSWGIDPPSDKSTPFSLEFQSWRLWVATLIASSIKSVKYNNDSEINEEEMLVLIRKKLSLEGIDCLTWAPTKNVSFLLK